MATDFPLRPLRNPCAHCVEPGPHLPHITVKNQILPPTKKSPIGEFRGPQPPRRLAKGTDGMAQLFSFHFECLNRNPKEALLFSLFTIPCGRDRRGSPDGPEPAKGTEDYNRRARPAAQILSLFLGPEPLALRKDFGRIVAGTGLKFWLNGRVI